MFIFIKSLTKRAKLLFILIIFFGVLIRSLSLFAPLTELHDFRQTQTASTVWLYQKLGFTFPQYHVPMFGGKYWMLEFPTYQVIVYGLTKILGLHDFVGRLVSIFCCVISSALLFYISRKIVLFSEKYGLLTLFIFNLIPANLYFFRAYMLDPLVLTLTLLILVIGYHTFVNFDYKKSALFFILLILVTLTKVTTVFPIIFPLVFIFVKNYQKNISKNKRLLLVSLLGFSLTALLFLGWHFYTTSLNSQSFSLEDGSLKDWYFGTKYFYLPYYSTLIFRLFIEITPLGILLLIFGVYKISRIKSFVSKFLGIWLWGAILYLFIFNNLNDIHNYYQLPLYPLISIVIILGWIHLSAKFKNKQLAKSLEFTVFYLISVFSLFTYFVPSFWLIKIYKPNDQYTKSVSQISRTINRCTRENDKIVYIWPNADPNHPTVLYYSKRVGYNLDLFKLSSIIDLVGHDRNIRSLALFPISQNQKEAAINYLKNLELNISETCYNNNILILNL